MALLSIPTSADISIEVNGQKVAARAELPGAVGAGKPVHRGVWQP